MNSSTPPIRAQSSAATLASPTFGPIAKRNMVLVTTFRKSGQRVTTPVSAAWQGDNRFLVVTTTDSGKVKRLRHTARVTVATGTRDGKLTSEPVEGTARILEGEEAIRAKIILRSALGAAGVVFALMHAILRKKRAYLEVSAA